MKEEEEEDEYFEEEDKIPSLVGNLDKLERAGEFARKEKELTVTNFKRKNGPGNRINANGYYDYKKFEGYQSQPQLANTKGFIDLFDANQTGFKTLTELPLQPLDIEKDILDDSTLLFIGRRRSGKTWAARHVLYCLKNRFPCGLVITGTKLNGFWNNYIPKEFIHDLTKLNEVLDRVFARQRFLLSKPELGIDPRIFLILDDVLGEKMKVRYSKQLLKMFTDGRHFKIFIAVTTQDPRGVPPDLRECTDIAFIFRQFQQTRKEAVCNDFMDYIEDKNARAKFLWHHTAMVDKDGQPADEKNIDFYKGGDGVRPSVLCVLQSRTTSNVLQIFKKFIAEDPGKFVLGNDAYWKALATGNYQDIMGTYKPPK